MPVNIRKYKKTIRSMRSTNGLKTCFDLTVGNSRALKFNSSRINSMVPPRRRKVCETFVHNWDELTTNATLAANSNDKGFEVADEAEFEECWKNQTASVWSCSGEGSNRTSESQDDTSEEDEDQPQSGGEYCSNEEHIWASNENGEEDVNEETRKIYLTHEYLLSLRNFSNLTKTNVFLHQKLFEMQKSIDRLASGYRQTDPVDRRSRGPGTSSESYNIMGTNYTPQQAYRWQVIQYYSLQNYFMQYSEDAKLAEFKLKNSLDNSIEDYEFALQKLLEQVGCIPARNAANSSGRECAKEIIGTLLRLKNQIASFHYLSLKSHITLGKFSPHSSFGSLKLNGTSLRSIGESLKSIGESLKIIPPIREFENDALLYKTRIEAQKNLMANIRNTIINLIQAGAHTKEKIALLDKLQIEQQLQLQSLAEETEDVKVKHAAVSDLYRRLTSSDTFGDLKRSVKMQEDIGQLKLQTKKFYLQKSYMERVLKENECSREHS